MSMACEQFEQILEEMEDGALPQPALEHVEACQACRALTADLTVIHDLAMELGSEPIAPPERIWISLRNQLEMEGIIREPEAVRQPIPAVKPGWWAFLQGPVIAGSVLGLLLAAAALLGYLSNFSQAPVQTEMATPREVSPVPTADSVFKEEVLTVGNDSIPGLRRQDNAVTNSIRRNLQIVDNLIAVCEKSVREQPDNQMAREYLYGAYQQKAELLATAMNRSISGGVQ